MLAVAGVSVAALIAAGTTALAGPAAAAPTPAAGVPSVQAQTVKAQKMGTVVANWRTPSASRWAPAAAVTGPVSAGQHVRVVRLADVGGKPQISVSEAVGPSAAAQTVRDAQQTPGTVTVSVDVRRTALQTPVASTVAGGTDPLRADQWALTQLAAENAWQSTTGKGVTVAVVDTGVAVVPDLRGQVLNGADYVVPGGNGTADGHGHGTHVAGIIAAAAGNGIGIAGLAPGVKILPVRVLDASGSGYDSAIAAGIIYAADHGASVINLSLGGPDNDSVLAAAVRYAQSRNVVVVAAAGNSRLQDNATSYPAALPGVLAVGATNSANQVAAWSNSGPYVGIAAPGVDILSTVPRGYVRESGTSMASPYVAATAALVRAANRNLTAGQVVTDLTNTATDLAPTGRDYRSGKGLVNPRRAICAVATCPADTRFDLQAVPARVTAGKTVTVRAQLRTARGGGIANVRAQWCFSPTGQVAHCVSAVTDASGWISYPLVPRQSGTVFASFAGTSAWSLVTTAKRPITVVPAVTVRLARGMVAVTVSPAAAQPVQLQRWTGKVWQTVRSSATDSRGYVAWTGLASGATVRVTALAYGGRAAVTTGTYRIP